jgi:hypothetical protein
LKLLHQIKGWLVFLLASFEFLVILRHKASLRRFSPTRLFSLRPPGNGSIV